MNVATLKREVTELKKTIPIDKDSLRKLQSTAETLLVLKLLDKIHSGIELTDAELVFAEAMRVKSEAFDKAIEGKDKVLFPGDGYYYVNVNGEKIY